MSMTYIINNPEIRSVTYSVVVTGHGTSSYPQSFVVILTDAQRKGLGVDTAEATIRVRPGVSPEDVKWLKEATQPDSGVEISKLAFNEVDGEFVFLRVTTRVTEYYQAKRVAGFDWRTVIGDHDGGEREYPERVRFEGGGIDEGWFELAETPEVQGIADPHPAFVAHQIRYAVMNELPARVGICNVGGTRVVTEIEIGTVNG